MGQLGQYCINASVSPACVTQAVLHLCKEQCWEAPIASNRRSKPGREYRRQHAGLTAGAAKEAWPLSIFAFQVLSNGEGIIDDLAVIFDDWHLTHKHRLFRTLQMPRL